MNAEPRAPATRPDATVIIPARLGSTRFPRKMLARETGRPLIAHVVEAAHRAPGIARVCVATDSEEIAAAARDAGAVAVMTSVAHTNGSTRIDEAAQRLGFADEHIIVNVQGDEPEIEPQTIETAISALLGPPERDMGTAAAPFEPGQDAADPNMVKVVRRLDGSALYFSRARIPAGRPGAEEAAPAPLRHVGIYAYRRAFLRVYAGLASSPLERAESLEQLRALEHGRSIGVGLVESVRPGIDTPEQYEAFVSRWRDRAG